MKKKSLNSKIAKYSLLASAALLTLNSCGKDDGDSDKNDPNIEDQDINPDLSLTAPTNDDIEHLLDVNNDGVNDLSLTVGNSVYASYGVDYNYVNVDGLNGAEVVTTIENVSFGGYDYDVSLATALSEGNSISPSSTIWDDYGVLGSKGTYSGDPLSVGQFLSKDKYIGFRFSAAGSTHYGWLRVSVSANANSFSLKEYAYHKTPNTAIEAGAK